MFAYRIADSRHPIFDATGAMLHGGRWNSPGKRVIYTAETYAGALLEVLVHANLSRPPKHHKAVRITIPDEVSVETVSPSQIRDWESENSKASRAFGDAWFDEKRTVVLRVPSVITHGRENNLLINTEHPQFTLISSAGLEPVVWDARLFKPHRAE